MTRRFVVTLTLLIAACDVRSRPQLRWVGQVTPTTTAPDCPASRGVLLMRNDDVTFAPDEGVWTLQGKAETGRLKAARSRIGADKKPYETTLDATWTESRVTGAYTTPRCSYNVDLSRQ